MIRFALNFACLYRLFLGSIAVLCTALCTSPLSAQALGDPGTHIVFVTNEQFGIDTGTSFPPPASKINSINSADWQCTAAASDGGLIPGWNGLDIVYKSILSDSTIDARDHINVQGPVYSTGGFKVADDSVDLFDNSIDSSVTYDEFGDLVTSGFEAWSGSLSTGQHQISCGDWNDNSGGNFASFGSVTATNAFWLQSSIANCSGDLKIYCISPLLIDFVGDFNGDSIVDVEDLNRMLTRGPIAGGVAVTPGTEQFDLTGDGTIDLDDMHEWLDTAATFNGFSSPYKLGDANLDGTVNGQDFIVWNGNKFEESLPWSAGNFNGDSSVNGQDFIAWNANKFTSSDVVSVPEPSILALWVVGLAAIFRRQ